jgi:hypothetical protein
MDVERRQHRKLSTGGPNPACFSWSRDGRWIYFGSNRGGDWQVWRIFSDGGPVHRVTKHGGREAFEWLEGKYVYYARSSGDIWSPHSWSIWRTTAAGGGRDTRSRSRTAGLLGGLGPGHLLHRSHDDAPAVDSVRQLCHGPDEVHCSC